MKFRTGSLPIGLLVTALLVVAESGAQAWQSAVFQAVNFPSCGGGGTWKPIQEANESGITGTPLGFKDCADGFGFRGNGTPNDPYRLALDGKDESVDMNGLDATTRADYTVQVWFRVRSNKRDPMMLVDSRTHNFYVPLRMMVSNGKLQCSIEMPFPDRAYLASSSAPITTSTWHQGACRFRAQSRELSLFLDGKMSGSTRIPPGTIRSNRIRIGGDPLVERENFAGDIAEVVFLSESVAADEIRTRCRQESQRFANTRCQ